jgi:hypothetical protein
MSLERRGGLWIHRAKRRFSHSRRIAAETLPASVIAPHSNATLGVLTAPNQTNRMRWIDVAAEMAADGDSGCKIPNRVCRQLAVGRLHDVLELNRRT